MVNESKNILLGDKQTPGNVNIKTTKKRSFSEASKPSGELRGLQARSTRTTVVNKPITGGAQRATQQSHKADLRNLMKIVPKLSKEDLSKVVGTILKRRKRDPQPAQASRSRTQGCGTATVKTALRVVQPSAPTGDDASRARLTSSRFRTENKEESRSSVETLEPCTILKNEEDLAQELLDQAVRYLLYYICYI